MRVSSRLASSCSSDHPRRARGEVHEHLRDDDLAAKTERARRRHRRVRRRPGPAPARRAHPAQRRLARDRTPWSTVVSMSKASIAPAPHGCPSTLHIYIYIGKVITFT